MSLTLFFNADVNLDRIKQILIHEPTNTHLNTHVNLFDSVCELQSLVESVDIDSVRGVFVHEWTLGVNVEEKDKMHQVAQFVLFIQLNEKIASPTIFSDG